MSQPRFANLLLTSMMVLVVLEGCCTRAQITPVHKYAVKDIIPLVIGVNFLHGAHLAEKRAICGTLRKSLLFDEVICEDGNRGPVDAVLRIDRTSFKHGPQKAKNYAYTFATLGMCIFTSGGEGRATYLAEVVDPMHQDSGQILPLLREGFSASSTSYIASGPFGWLSLGPLWGPAFEDEGMYKCWDEHWKEMGDRVGVALVRWLVGGRESLLSYAHDRRAVSDSLAPFRKRPSVRTTAASSQAEATTGSILQGAPESSLTTLRLAVMDIVDRDNLIPREILATATQHLRTDLATSGRFLIVDRTKQQDALRALIKKEKHESYKACHAKSCQIPLGKALAANTLISCGITRLGRSLNLGCELIDLAGENTVGAAVAEFDGSAISLKTAIEDVVEQLNRAH
jgi:hypothetical protein